MTCELCLTGDVALDVDHLLVIVEGDALADVVVLGVGGVLPLEGGAHKRVGHGCVVGILGSYSVVS